MIRKRWLKHGDDPSVIKPPRNSGVAPDAGLFPTPMGCITIRPGDWICVDDSGRRTVETDPAILGDLHKLASALEHSADHDEPENKRRTMFNVAKALFEIKLP